jgi:hypothetical protein
VRDVHLIYVPLDPKWDAFRGNERVERTRPVRSTVWARTAALPGRRGCDSSRRDRWADRVQLVDAKHVGTWELPALGAVTAPTAMLIGPTAMWPGRETEPRWGSLTR